MKNYGVNRNKMSKKNMYIAIAFIIFTTIVFIVISVSRKVKQSEHLNSINDLPNAAQTQSVKTDVKKNISDEQNLNANDLNEDNSNKNYDVKIFENKAVKSPKVDETPKRKVKEVEEKEVTSDKTEQDTKPPVKLTFVKPVEGSLIQNFSNNELVFSKTLGEFRTHNGIDIEALPLTSVKAVADGTVINVENDEGRWGTCLEIKHENDLISIYRGLDENLNVKIDSKVRSGEIIGSVGDSNMFEGALNSHLHFEIKKGEDFLNPLDYVTYENVETE